MASQDARLPDKPTVDHVVASYQGFVARARSGVPASRPSTSTPPQAGPRTVGYYKRYQLDGRQRWAIQLEDERDGDWLCVDPRNGKVPTFSAVPTARAVLVHFELPDHVVMQLEQPPTAFTRMDTWPPETTNLDLIAPWLQNPDTAAIPYDQFMDLWQLFEMLPTQSEPRLSNRELWLSSAVYQHLWIGIMRCPSTYLSHTGKPTS